MTPLPEGFVLDQPSAPPLPQGFVLYQPPNVPVSPAWRRQALINAVVAAQGGTAQPSSPKFSNAPQ
jgi:hypothetical protein